MSDVHGRREFVLGMVADAERNSTPSKKRDDDPEPLAMLGVARFPGQLGETAQELADEGLLYFVNEAWHSRNYYRNWVMRGGDAGSAGRESE